MFAGRDGRQGRQVLERRTVDRDRGQGALVLLVSLLPAVLVALLWWIGWETRIDNRFHPLASAWSLLLALAISAASISFGIWHCRYGATAAGVVGLLVPLGVGIALQLGGDVEYALNCRQYHECSDAQFMLLSVWGIWGSVTTSSILLGLRLPGGMEGARRLILALAAIALGAYGGYAVGWWYGLFIGFVAGAVVGLFALFMPRSRR